MDGIGFALAKKNWVDTIIL